MKVIDQRTLSPRWGPERCKSRHWCTSDHLLPIMFCLLFRFRTVIWHVGFEIEWLCAAGG